MRASAGALGAAGRRKGQLPAPGRAEGIGAIRGAPEAGGGTSCEGGGARVGTSDSCRDGRGCRRRVGRQEKQSTAASSARRGERGARPRQGAAGRPGHKASQTRGGPGATSISRASAARSRLGGQGRELRLELFLRCCLVCGARARVSFRTPQLKRAQHSRVRASVTTFARKREGWEQHNAPPSNRKARLPPRLRKGPKGPRARAPGRRRSPRCPAPACPPPWRRRRAARRTARRQRRGASRRGSPRRRRRGTARGAGAPWRPPAPPAARARW